MSSTPFDPRLTRRTLLIGGGSALLLAACRSGNDTAPTTTVFFPDGTTTTTAGDTTTPTTAPAESGEALRLLIPPDSIADEVFAAAATSIGLPVVVEVYVDPAFVLDRLNAQQGTYAYDLIVTPGAFLPSAIDAGLVQRLDPQLLPSVAGQLESVRTSPFDPDGLYSVCKEVGYTGYAWDRQVLPDGIASWEAFLEAAARDGVSGRVTGLAEGAELAAIPTWARGERTPADFDIAAAEQELTEVLLSHLADLDSSPSARMLEGEVALAQMWNGEGRALVASDPDRWGYAIGGPVTGVWMERFVIPVGAPNVAAAHAFIETMLQPEVSLSQVDRRGYNTGVASIQDTITTLPGADLIPTGEAMFGDSKDYGESLLDASYADLRGLVVGVMTDVLDTAATEAPTTTPPVEPPASDPPTTTDGTPPVTAAPTPTTVQVDAKGRRVLRPQDTGPEVAALQERLKALGFSVGRADGQFGDVTLAAVLAFQRSQGLQTDGVVGRFTWDALENPKPIVSRSPNTRGAQSGAPSDAAQHAPRGAASGGKWTKAVVYLDSFRSEFYDGNGNLAATFPNSPGVNGLTPTGTFRVYSRSADTYYSKNPAEKMKWMVRFNGGIGFHSVPRINDVPEPTPLGQAPSSHGCIRHADENAKAVFDNLVDGATVIVRHG